MDDKCVETLKRVFGYVPNKALGEKWVVYRDKTLLVFHPDERVKVYREGDGGSIWAEIEPRPDLYGL